MSPAHAWLEEVEAEAHSESKRVDAAICDASYRAFREAYRLGDATTGEARMAHLAKLRSAIKELNRLVPDA
jgi:uncharacterized protein (DUF2267 family)